MKTLFFLYFACLSLLGTLLGKEEQKVLFLGDSICYAAHWPALIEGALRENAAYKDAQIVNVGLPSETACSLTDEGHAGGRFPRPTVHERLGRVLKEYKPTLVLACYGMNDGLMKPLDEKRFKIFQEGLARLKKEVEKTKAQLIFITPSFCRLDQNPQDEYDKTLEAYSQWMEGQKQKGWKVINIRPALRESIANYKKQNPGFIFAGDGIHPTPEGHRLMAEQIWKGLAPYLKLNAQTPLPTGEAYNALYAKHVAQRNEALTKTQHLRPEIPGYNEKLPQPKLILESNKPSQKDATTTTAEPINIICLGDSITFGVGAGVEDRWSSQLQKGLGDKYKVTNLGISGRTLLSKGDLPYIHTGEYKRALEAKADVAFIALGTNDSKPHNWKNGKDFENDYKALIKALKESNPKMKIYCLKAVPCYHPQDAICDKVIREEVNPLIEKVAKQTKSQLIDLYTPMLGERGMLPDTIHPNGAGHKLMANRIFAAFTGKEIDPSIQTSDWSGYEKKSFLVEGRPAFVICPKTPAKGNPWIWRTEFFGVEPQTDLALLEKGYFVSYINLTNLYGCPASVKIMDSFYAFVRKEFKLSPKVILEGLSRGGLFAFNWAAAHPKSVAALYVDAPVCDFKSWPGGKGKSKGSPGDWKNLLQVYGLTEEEALKYKLNPIDNLAPLARAKVPVLAVVGEVDDVVPVEENMNIVEKRYKELGGPIKVIRKPNGNHHPHSLKDPAPIVDFLLKATQKG